MQSVICVATVRLMHNYRSASSNRNTTKHQTWIQKFSICLV